MNSLKVLGIIKQSLIRSAGENNSLLRGVSVETDPYRQLENRLPFVLIEEGATLLITNPQGSILEYLHTLEITCAVNAAGKERNEYKTNAALLADNCLKTICAVSDYRLKIIPKEMYAGEMIAGSAKCSGVKMIIEVKSLFIDE